MPKFIVKIDGKPDTSFVMEEEDIFIGRVPTINDICIQDPSVSRQHAHVKKREEGYTIYDLKSLNGILLNGTRVSRSVLQHGDKLRLGDVDLIVEFNEVGAEEGLQQIEDSEKTQASFDEDRDRNEKDEITIQSQVPYSPGNPKKKAKKKSKKK